MSTTSPRRRGVPVGVLTVSLGAVLALAACGGQESGGDGLTGEVRVDGSSTVAPLSAAAGEQFKEQEPGVNVSVGTSGTGGGFKKFCAGETDISDASRPIKDEEAADCEANGVGFTEIVVANDALSVIVNKENTWATCLTTAQLKTIWEPAAEGKITNWNQVDPAFPDVPLELYGAGTDSGTFDYFTDVINGAEGASRTDYSPSEDDNVTVTGVQGSKGAMGYLGFSYYEENQDQLNVVAIDSGNGCVTPSSESAQNGEYTPLARPLFIYASHSSFTDKDYVAAFVTFYVENDESITEAARFIPLSDQQRQQSQDELASLRAL